MSKINHTVEFRTGALEAELSDEQLERFSAALFVNRTIAGPAVRVDGTVNALEIRASVDATHTLDAIATVSEAVHRALNAAEITATQGRIEAWPDIIGVDYPDELVNGGEIARRLRISRERLRQLVTEGRIPRPVAETERDRIWRWGDVAEWAALNERKTKVPRRKPDAEEIVRRFSTAATNEAKAREIRRVVALANTGDAKAASFLRAVPQLAHFDDGRGRWVDTIDAALGAHNVKQRARKKTA